jgi:hypothetical protein
MDVNSRPQAVGGWLLEVDFVDMFAQNLDDRGGGEVNLIRVRLLTHPCFSTNRYSCVSSSSSSFRPKPIVLAEELIGFGTLNLSDMFGKI